MPVLYADLVSIARSKPTAFQAVSFPQVSPFRCLGTYNCGLARGNGSRAVLGTWSWRTVAPPQPLDARRFRRLSVACPTCWL